MIDLRTAHPHPKVIATIDPIMYAFELDDENMMQQIANRLHHIYVYPLNSKVDGQPMFEEHVVKQVVELLANEIGRLIAEGKILPPEEE